jgi:hypothetical protein
VNPDPVFLVGRNRHEEAFALRCGRMRLRCLDEELCGKLGDDGLR